jgi:hypothetical protein
MLICAFNLSLLCARIETGCLLFDKLGLIPFALSTNSRRKNCYTNQNIEAYVWYN